MRRVLEMVMPAAEKALVEQRSGSRWKTLVKAAALVVLCAAPAAAGVGFFAADRFSDALGAGGQPAISGTVDADAWGSLGELGQKVDFGLFVSRAALDGAVSQEFDKAGPAGRDVDLGEDARLRIAGVELAPNGATLSMTLRGRVETGFFGAGLSARATLQPRLDAAGVVFSPGSVDIVVEGAALKRPTLNPADAAAKAEPAVAAASQRLRETLTGLGDGLTLPVALPSLGKATGKLSKTSAAFMFDTDGLHLIGRLDAAPKAGTDDDLLTGSLASAGLTTDHYRAAFRAARDKFIAVSDPAGAAAEVAFSRDALSKMLDDAGERICAPMPVETEPLTLTGQVRVSDPPPAPQCGRIAAACAARDLCAQAAECQDKVVEETVEETVKVPVRRSGCARREYVCYGWGPYGCAWGENVCVAPRRTTEYRDKIVQRVVARTEQASAPKCQTLRQMQGEDPGFCRRLTAGKAPECSLVSDAGSVADCQARGAILERLREAPTATATLRIIGRGALQSCTKATLAADMASARVATSLAGKVDIVAEVTIRPDARSDSDTALRCTLEPAAAVKTSAKVQISWASTLPMQAASTDGVLALAGRGEAGTISIPLDKAVTGALFGGKSGLTYRCRVEGVAGTTFAQWENRIGPALEEMAAKAGKLVSMSTAPSYEARLPRALLLGRDAEARMTNSGAVFSVR